jgi:hypothetical protein
LKQFCAVAKLGIFFHGIKGKGIDGSGFFLSLVTKYDVAKPVYNIKFKLAFSLFNP